MNERSDPLSRILGLGETCFHPGASGHLRSREEAGSPGKSWQAQPLTTGHAGPSLQTPLAWCLGQEPGQSLGVVTALPQGPEAELERRRPPGRAPAAGGAAGAGTKDGARGSQPALGPPASDAVLGPLGKGRAPEAHVELGEPRARREAEQEGDRWEDPWVPFQGGPSVCPRRSLDF